MKTIAIIGSGRSSIYLIEYMAEYCLKNEISLKVVDKDTSFVQASLNFSKGIEFTDTDISDSSVLESIIQNSTLAVSMLPAFMHPMVAGLCLKHKVHLATASYVSDSILDMQDQAIAQDLIFLNEMGLDPGIDHMSAMKIMDEIREDGGKITGFKSFCGGLVADEDDGDNPWKYKFSWNPRNVILAAQGAPAQYLENGEMKIVSYQRIFGHPHQYNIPAYGILEAYPNRDSLKYIDMYGLHHLKDMQRGTFRKPGFCNAWQVFVQLGMTDDVLKLKLPEHCTMSEWLEMYLPGTSLNTRDKLKWTLHVSEEVLDKFEWLGFFSDELLPIHEGTAALILEEILKTKWKLNEADKDLVVMLHHINYEKDGESHTVESSFILKGESNTHTAMAKTVGLPLAIGCKMILENLISERGVITPVKKEIYDYVLTELEGFGIIFKEEKTNPSKSQEINR